MKSVVLRKNRKSEAEALLTAESLIKLPWGVKIFLRTNLPDSRMQRVGVYTLISINMVQSKSALL